MIVNPDSPRYCSYLLRCWQEQSVIHLGTAAWRFSLEDPHTGERYGFATFDALMAFLRRILVPAQPDAASGASGHEGGRGNTG